MRSQFDGKSPVLSPNFAADLGSYLGEVVIANIGGVWAADGSPSVTNIGAVEAIFPIDKARKRLERGPSESLEYYLTVIARHAKASDQGDQPT